MIELNVFLFVIHTCAITTVVLFVCSSKTTGTDDKPAEKKKGKGKGSIWDMDYYGESTVDDQQIEGSKVQTMSTPGTKTIMAKDGRSKVQTEVKPEKGGKTEATKATTVAKPSLEGKSEVPRVNEQEKALESDATKAPPVAKPLPEINPKVPTVVEPEKVPRTDATKALPVAKPPPESKPKVPTVVEPEKGPKADATEVPPVAKPQAEGATKVPPVAKPQAEGATKVPPVAKPQAGVNPKVPTVVKAEKGPNAAIVEKPQITITPTVFKWEFLAGQDVFKVQNTGGMRVAFKIKTSDNGIYTVNPVSGFLEAGKTIPIVIIRKQCPFKPDKIECLAVGVTPNEKDAMNVFNGPNVRSETFTVKMEKKPELPSAKQPEKK